MEKRVKGREINDILKLEQKWTNGKWLRAEKAKFQAEIERRLQPIYFMPQDF